MKVAPLDLRKARFSTAIRGFDRTEVASYLSEAADGYERALLDADRLRQEIGSLQTQLEEHRERESTLRDTLLTAQRLAAEVRESAKQEAQLIVREARGRADELVRESRTQCQEIEQGIAELRMKRSDVATSLEGSIATLRHALERVRQQDDPPNGETAVSRLGPRPLVSAKGAGPTPVRSHPTKTAGEPKSSA